jgi:hypothetical protein
MPFLVPYSRSKPVPENSHNGPALGYKGHGIIVIAEKKAIGWVLALSFPAICFSCRNLPANLLFQP